MCAVPSHGTFPMDKPGIHYYPPGKNPSNAHGRIFGAARVISFSWNRLQTRYSRCW